MLVQGRITDDETVNRPGDRLGGATILVGGKMMNYLFDGTATAAISFLVRVVSRTRVARVRHHQLNVVNLYWVAGGFLHP